MHCSLFTAFQPILGLLWRFWICSVCFFDSKDLNSRCCWHSSIPPFLELSPSGDWGDILYYAISGRLRSLGVQLLFLFRTRPWLPLPFLQLCSPRPILIWQSHQACFLEDAISSTSTQGWSTLFWQHLPCHWSGLQLAPWFSISMFTLCCQALAYTKPMISS